MFGSGKTKAGKNAINSDTDEIGLDTICITRELNEIFGHFDMGVRGINVPDEIEKRQKIEYFVYMLNEEETEGRFNGNKKEIIKVDFKTFTNISINNIYLSISVTTDITHEAKYKRFIELVDVAEIYISSLDG